MCLLIGFLLLIFDIVSYTRTFFVMRKKIRKSRLIYIYKYTFEIMYLNRRHVAVIIGYNLDGFYLQYD